LKTYLLTSIAASLAAGRAILDVYHSDFEVQYKADDSPLTLADRRSHAIIASGLAAFKLPVLSEEGVDIPFSERRAWQLFWLVDPLDGTKEFVKRNGEFTVNIALVEGRRPIMGVIYVPVLDVLYFGARGMGAFRIDSASKVPLPIESQPGLRADGIVDGLLAQAVRLPGATSPPVYTVIGSRSHRGPDLGAYIENLRRQYGEIQYLSAGSSLKFCRVAEGAADIYPRLAPTMEWDTAAGQAVVEGAGFQVVRYDNHEPLRYNKENLLNPWFIVESGIHGKRQVTR